MIRPPIAAVIDATGKPRPLVTAAEPHVQVTEEQVRDVPTLARMMLTILRAIVALERRPYPRRIDHEDIAVNGDGVTQYILPHGFSGRVRWWVVDCLTSDGTLTRDDAATTDDVLVLLSNAAGTVTVRIEEVGG